MKRIFTSLSMVLLALAISVNVTAQVRKTWDFTNLSQETYDNLVADLGNNWESEGTNDDGSHKGFKSKGKLSGELTANGQVVSELQHLNFGTSGLKGGDYILRSNVFRMGLWIGVYRSSGTGSGRRHRWACRATGRQCLRRQ